MRSLVVLLLTIVVLAAVGWGLYSHQLFLRTDEVQLPEPTAADESSSTPYYVSGFDGGVRNTPKGEAVLGTAQVGFAVMETGSIGFQLAHADSTRVRNLHLRLLGPSGWQPAFIFPSGDGWGEISHNVGMDGLRLDFDRLGNRREGYRGTINLTFPGEPGMQWTEDDRLQAEVVFDLYQEGFRLGRWHVRGLWDIPLSPN